MTETEKNFVLKNEKDFSQKISQKFLPKREVLAKEKKKKNFSEI